MYAVHWQSVYVCRLIVAYCTLIQFPLVDILTFGIGISIFLLQLDFCDEACLDRYLKARGNNVRKAARMLLATLQWREKNEIGEFSNIPCACLLAREYRPLHVGLVALLMLIIR